MDGKREFKEWRNSSDASYVNLEPVFVIGCCSAPI